MKNLEELMKLAGSAEPEELWVALRAQHIKLFERAAVNWNLTEDMALYIAKSRNVSAETLGVLAGDVRFKRSYKLMIVLCQNPKTPQRIVLALLKNLKIFDLGDLTRDQFIPSVTRQKVEQMLFERIPSMPPGLKVALSRRASVIIILKLLEHADKRTAEACLESPRLTEARVSTFLMREATKPAVVKAVAESPKWSVLYSVRYALLRNFHTPMQYVSTAVSEVKTQDLRELYADKKVPASSKPFIYSELSTRGVDTEIPPEEILEVGEDEDEALRDDLEVSGLLKPGPHMLDREAALENEEPDDSEGQDGSVCGWSEPGSK